MNLEDEILTNLSKELSEAVNKELFAGLLEEDGWIRVVARRPVVLIQDPESFLEWLEEVHVWCKNLCSEKDFYMITVDTFLFKRQSDASMFALKWG